MLTETKARQATFSSERVFFTGTGLWFAALTIAGFWNTFYYRALPDPLPTHQILHGVLYSGWVALFLAQAVLIATKRVRWHVALGSASVLLLVLMIPAGFHVVLVKTLAGLKSVDEAGFNLVGLTLGFAFAVAGLLNRAQPPVHKRLMMFATLMLTVAAADRVALAFGLDDVRLFRKVLAVTPGLALVGYDAWSQRRVPILSVSLLALVWLVLWFVVSDMVFTRPEGEAIVRALTYVFVW